MQVPVSKAETEAHTLKFNLMKALLLCKIRFLFVNKIICFFHRLLYKNPIVLSKNIKDTRPSYS